MGEFNCNGKAGVFNLNADMAEMLWFASEHKLSDLKLTFIPMERELNLYHFCAVLKILKICLKKFPSVGYFFLILTAISLFVF
jgi:hypothetical protein